MDGVICSKHSLAVAFPSRVAPRSTPLLELKRLSCSLRFYLEVGYLEFGVYFPVETPL